MAGPALTCDSLEKLVRERVHEMIQEILEEEVTVLLGRNSERSGAVSGPTATDSPMPRAVESKSNSGQSAASASA